MALGVLQGPTELLPVSSSGHTTLIPWLAGWSYAELDPELRKAFEVALHAGAGAALAIDMRTELIEATRTLDRRRAAMIALSLLPAAIAGYVLEEPIERRLGGPCSIAAGLIAGAVAMTAA
ncbi:MAG: undecaprenyl-diphosphate phosphatase, partial [Solirubrobacteraceae bacterium]